MRQTFYIFWKDLGLIITSPMFYIVGGIASCIWSYVFLRSIALFATRSSMAAMYGQGQEGNLHYLVTIEHLHLVNLIFIFTIPAITMRLLSEEKKNATYNLLLTCPLTSSQIVAGKFFAGVGASLLWLFISMIYPLSTLFISDVSVAPLLTAFSGMILLVCVYVSLGIFASSLTSSLVLSVILGFLFNIILWFIGSGVGTGPSFLTEFTQQLSLSQHFLDFFRGSVKIKGIVYFFSCSCLFLFLSERVVEAVRWRS